MDGRLVVGSSGLSDDKMIVDWPSFTLPYQEGLNVVQLFFGQPEDRPVGIRGYSNSATRASSGVVGWSPERPDQECTSNCQAPL